jgi:hypothetical protein
MRKGWTPPGVAVMMVGMVRLRGRLWVAIWMATFAGCLGGESLGNHSVPAGSGGTTATSATGGAVGTGGLGSGAGPFCATVNFGITAPVAPDVLIVMDRSSSMNDDSNEMICTGGCGASSKWTLAWTAIGGMVSTHPSVNWGLAFYGSGAGVDGGVDDSCDVTVGAAVDVGPSSAPAIEAALAATAPGGEAPTSAAITNAVSYLLSLTDAGPKYILLVTDGQSGCAGSDGGAATLAAESAIASAAGDSGIPTFVVGLAPDWDTTAVTALNQMAVNGGEASQGTATSYDSLANIGGQFMLTTSLATSCVIPLSYPLAPATDLAITATTADGASVSIPEDPTDGWAFTDPTLSNVVLNGSACLAVQDGSYAGITIAYECYGIPTLERGRANAAR